MDIGKDDIDEDDIDVEDIGEDDIDEDDELQQGWDPLVRGLVCL